MQLVRLLRSDTQDRRHNATGFDGEPRAAPLWPWLVGNAGRWPARHYSNTAILKGARLLDIQPGAGGVLQFLLLYAHKFAPSGLNALPGQTPSLDFDWPLNGCDHLALVEIVSYSRPATS